MTNEVKNHYPEVKASVDLLGTGKVEVDGQDVSDRIQGFSIQVRRGQPNQIVLEMAPGAAELRVDGVVHVADEAAFPEAVMRMLRAVPAQALEQEVLNHPRLSELGMGATMMEVLIEWVQRAGGN